MAARSVVAMERERAVSRLRNALDGVSRNLGLGLPTEPPFFKDPDYNQMVQLQWIADCVEAISVVTAEVMETRGVVVTDEGQVGESVEITPANESAETEQSPSDAPVEPAKRKGRK